MKSDWTPRTFGPTPAGRHLGNTLDPNHPSARMNLTVSFHDYRDPAALDRAWNQHIEWINANEIGPPSNCKAGSSHEMGAQGYVGIYEKARTDQTCPDTDNAIMVINVTQIGILWNNPENNFALTLTESGEEPICGGECRLEIYSGEVVTTEQAQRKASFLARAGLTVEISEEEADDSTEPVSKTCDMCNGVIFRRLGLQYECMCCGALVEQD